MKYFGTDGVRGIAYEKLNPTFAFKLGQGIYHAFKPQEVVIGMDTRESSSMLSFAIANGLMALGVNILYAGVVSTPMLAYYARSKDLIGIMITASHNPYTDNGIKVFNKGYKTHEEDELKIESFIDEGVISYQTFGKMIKTDDVTQLYLNLYDSLDLPHFHLRVGYDCANGANYQIAQTIMNRYVDHSIQIHGNPDGLNINLNCGSTHLDAIKELVKEQKLEIGFSFDGDGDRIMVVDQNQKVYDGDLLIYVISKYLKYKNLLNQNKVVLTKMSNPGLLKALSDHGISAHLTDVGDKYVYQALSEQSLSIGGESSGHIIIPYLLHTGDGLLVALFLLKVLHEMNQSLEELTQDLTLFPFKLTNIKGIHKSVLNLPAVQEEINRAKMELSKHSLCLIRPSGTEDLIRITISDESEETVLKVTQRLVDIISKEGIHQ